MPGDGNSVEAWMLTPADHALVMTKNGANRLGFAVLLLFYRTHGRFPRKPIEIGEATVVRVARQLGVESDDHDWYDTTSQTWKRHRAEIRAWLGFREATVADAELLEAWLRDQIPAIGVVPDQLIVLVETRCRGLSIESPALDRVDRIARAAIHDHDRRFCAGILGRLGPGTRARLEALLRPARTEAGSPISDPSAQPAPALLLRLRSDPGRPGLAAVQDELAKLELVRQIELPPGLFDGVLPHELDRYRRRVSAEAPYEAPPAPGGGETHLACSVRAPAQPDTDRFQAEMREALRTLDAGMPTNRLVRISRKRNKEGWITVTPFDPQPEPANLIALKAEIVATWPMTNLLDMLKETDLRLNFTDVLKSATAYETLDRSALRPRSPSRSAGCWRSSSRRG